MSLEHWHRVKDLFEEAQQRPPSERAIWLDTACEDDMLRAYVERLLAADGEADAYFDTLGDAIHPDDDAPVLPERAGPYKILGVLGVGGMGAVYRAERADGAYRQEVAVKLVRRAVYSPEAASRFRVERQALAALRHPNIAHLVDGGLTDDGLPFLAMELVDGEAITTYADMHRLDVEARVRLFLQVCDALQHAHRRLVVHRDLKPSNVLVAEDDRKQPIVKLLDFGIAKLLDEDGELTTPLTEAGQRLMTPEYAAPEQMRGGEITTSTDVYAAGVLLYELLTGHRPYDLTDRDAASVAKAVLEQEPSRPSTIVGRARDRRSARGETRTVTPVEVSAARTTTPQSLQRRLRGDLDRVVLKALRKEPERRYASVEALAEDLRRHLDGLPVTARPATVGYRMQTFVRRHRIAVTGAAFVLLTLVGGLAASLWQANRAERAAEQARVEAAKAQEVTAFLIDLFRRPDPNVSAVGSDSLIAARDLLDRGVEDIDALVDQPEVQASLLEAVALTYHGLGFYDEAERVASRSLALRRAHVGEVHPDVASSLGTLGGIAVSRTDLDAAVDHYREALLIYEALPDSDPEAIAETYSRIGIAEATRNRPDEAEAAYREALARKRVTRGDSSSEVATLLHNLADLYRHRGQLDDAVVLFDSSIAIQQAIPGGVLLGSSLTLRSLALRDRGDVAEAMRSAMEAIGLLQERFPPGHVRLVRAQVAYGSTLVLASDYGAAEPILREALAIHIVREGPDHWRTAETGLWLGFALFRQGKFAEAEPLLVDGFAVLRALRGDGDLYVEQVRQALFALYDAWGRPEQAAAYRPIG